MNERKQLVIKKAHQLFVEKGFQATSIQDILDYSEISKGTFYNYFSSKNELLIAIIKDIFKQLEKERNDLLLGQDPANIEIFIQQINLQLKTNRENNLLPLFEEVLFSKDVELKQFLKEGQIRLIQWVYNRFIEIFGENKQDYLLDCAIMFMAILQSNLKYSRMAYDQTANTDEIVRYSVNRMMNMVKEVSREKEQLIGPEMLEKWLPGSSVHSYKQKLYTVIMNIRKALKNEAEKEYEKYTELLDFIQDELHTNNPRKFLVESAIQSLKTTKTAYQEVKLLEELLRVSK